MKCSNCEEVWHQLPDSEEISAVDEIPEDIPEAVKPIPEGSSVPALAEEEQAGGSGRFGGYAAAASVFLIVFAWLLVFHQPVARAWPPSQLLYGLFGMETVLPGEGLVFERLQVSWGRENGKQALLVQGGILNLSAERKAIPLLQAEARDEDGEAFARWLIQIDESYVEAGENLSFRSVYGQNESLEVAQEVNVRFVMRMPEEAQPKTDAEDAGSIPAHDPGAQTHPSDDAKAVESH